VLGCALAAMLVIAMWGSITSTHLYKDRFSDRVNVQARVVINDWSLKLAREKPLGGWGYGSFDRVKNASNFSAGSLDRMNLLHYTSHNTFLTIFVETGILGLALVLVPWLVVGAAALVRARQPREDRWILVALLAILGVWVINAGAIDMRFFSFVGALPWLAVGLLRRRLIDDRSSAAAS
jgi:O-antigen ligase